MKIWIARGKSFGDYFIFRTKPKRDKNGMIKGVFQDDSGYLSFVRGYRWNCGVIKEGECKRFELKETE